MLLADQISIARQFLRSVRIDADWGNEAALRGFICQASAKHVIESMCQQFASTKQAAFTWTGPFGGGKSSLALSFASLLGADKRIRDLAFEIFGDDVVNLLKESLGLNLENEPWKVIPVVGQRSDPVLEIVSAIRKSGIPYIGRRLGPSPDGRRVIRTLVDLAEARPNNGVLLVIDELGKFLEYASSQAGDIHFFQELAEAASRCKGRLLIVGVLHQAFGQYATRLGREIRDEWSKIQGRFVDITLSVGVDEVLELSSRAIDSANLSHPYSKSWCEVIAANIRKNRAAVSLDLAQKLDQCWPLHPITATLLGAVSKHRFAQNERSTFGFLSSAEPGGFSEFLKTTDFDSNKVYEPDLYWDYLRENLEGSILSSSEGHRFAQCLDSVERCLAKGSSLHLKLIKAIALIDLFRSGSGLSANEAVLATCAPEASRKEIEEALCDMAKWSQIIYRKHLDTWAIYQGSDFDIDAAVAEVLMLNPSLDIKKLSALAGLRPILPKRHYQQTGALRWFGLDLVSIDDLQEAVSNFDPESGISGHFFMVIPNQDEDIDSLHVKCSEASSNTEYPIALGVSENTERIISLGREYLALEAVQESNTALAGDSVARRELKIRSMAVLGRIHDGLEHALSSAKWHVKGKAYTLDGSSSLSSLASTLSDEAYHLCPPIFSELVNRSFVSSNTQAALNALAVAMINHHKQEAFGIEGFPAERGLYETVLKASKLHMHAESGLWQFSKPSKGFHSEGLVALWEAADQILQTRGRVNLAEIHACWSKPPFGLRKGLLGLLGLTYIIMNQNVLATYRDGVYQPETDRDFVHDVLRHPRCIDLQFVVHDEAYRDLLTAFSAAIQQTSGRSCIAEPLAVGRSLVKLVLDLPDWARRTASYPNSTTKLRRILLQANDPYKLLLIDIPNLYATSDPEMLSHKLADDLRLLCGAYPALLVRLKNNLFKMLAADLSDLETLHRRAKSVKGLSGDFKLDSFAGRLMEFDGSDMAIEGLGSLMLNLPVTDWTDATPDAIELALADMSLKFRHAEMLAAVKDRTPTRHAIGLVFGTANQGRTVMRSIDVGLEEQGQVTKMSSKLLEVLSGGSGETRLSLAALAEAGALLLEREV